MNHYRQLSIKYILEHHPVSTFFDIIKCLEHEVLFTMLFFNFSISTPMPTMPNGHRPLLRLACLWGWENCEAKAAPSVQEIESSSSSEGTHKLYLKEWWF
jgi:hypothetical protein